MERLHLFYTFVSTAALCSLAVGYYYEKDKNRHYESGQIVNASALEAAGCGKDWISLVENKR